MRLEWGELIRYRKWEEFEKLAKRNPSQQLCDTLYELIKGIEEPADRKILKKALYFVKTAGFTPMVEWPEEDAVPKLPPVGVVGIMFSSTCHGYVGYTFAVIRAGTVYICSVLSSPRFRSMHIHLNKGSAEVFPETRPLLFNTGIGVLKREMEPAYILHRIRRDYESSLEERRFGRFNAFWKQVFTHVPTEYPHPAEFMDMGEPISEEELRALMEHPATVTWRIFLTPDDPFWEEIHALRWNEELTDEERAQGIYEVLMSDRTRICDEVLIADMVLRFLDLAAIIGVEDPLAGQMLQASQSLIDRRSRSVIFEALARHTSEQIEEDVEIDEIEQSAFPKGGPGK
jgi:hypothetical protein